MVPEEKIAELRERIDIVSLVGEYVRLTKSGVSFKGLCPFHDEKTPSFYVHPARRFFHCFGCSASGDALAFVMRLEGLSFPETLQRLAERVGMELPNENDAAAAESQRRKRRRDALLDVMDAATGYYVQELGRNELGSMARDAIAGRGVSEETAAHFRLGYAPEGWDGLVGFLRHRGVSLEDASELGLIVPRRDGGGFYDRFRHRLMFPIADVHGRIVAFSGRALPPAPGARVPDEPPAKYINSPEGPLYKKGAVLYGLFEGRVDIRRQGLVIVCEGNFDLVALHQAGFANAVAPMGTAFTEAHAQLLRRFADKAILLFDGDAAGARAVRAAYPLLQKASIAAQVVALPPGDDPDSFLRSRGADRLRELVKNAPPVVPYLIDRAASEALSDPQAKAQAIADLGPLLLSVDNPVEVPLYIERIAQRFGISDLSALRQQLHRGVRAARSGPANRHPSEGAEEPEVRVAKKEFVVPPLQADLFCAILNHPDLFSTPEAERLHQLLTNPDLRTMFQVTSRMVEQRGVLDAAALVRELEGCVGLSWLMGQLARQGDQDLGEARRLLRDGLPRLARQNIEGELPRLRQSILDARRGGDEALALALTQELVELTRTAHKLKQGSTKR